MCERTTGRGVHGCCTRRDSSLIFQHRSDLSIERGHLVLNNVPDDLRIQTEILMNQNISKTGHFLLFQRGVLGTEILGEFLDGLANDFKIPDDCV